MSISDFFIGGGGGTTFSWEKWSTKVECFSGKQKYNAQRPIYNDLGKFKKAKC